MTITGASIAPNTTVVSGSGNSWVVSTSNILPSQTNAAHTYAPALTVTAMASYSISAASWASGTFSNGQITLTTTAAHPFVPGSVLQFSGFTGNWAALNGLQFIAQSGTTGSTIVAGLYTGGTSSIALANPGSYSSGAGAVAGTIEPNMYIPGVSGAVYISPFGTFASSGTGGVGTYGLTSNSEGGYSITGGITGTALVLTAVPASGTFYEWVAPGSGLATTGGVSSGTIVQSQSAGTAGGVGTYAVNNSQTITAGTVMATNGNVWSSGAPGNLYAANSYFYTVAPSYTAAGGGVLTPRTTAAFGDLFAYIGAKSATAGQASQVPWGGELANIGNHWGVFPQDANGNPSTASLASLCEKTTDYRAFDAANGITTKTIYRLNDPGEWGDSSNATITGYLSGASGTSGGTATLNVSSTVFGSLALSTGTETAFLAAPGLPPSPTPASVNPASIPLTTSASSTYTVTFPTGVTSINLGSSGSPVTFSVGQWKPAVPLGNAPINGYITNSGGSGVCASNPCLTVTSIQTGASTLGATFTGTYNPAAATNNLTVSGITGTIQSGMLITDGGVSLTGAPLLELTASCTATCTASGGYYSSTIGPESMTASLATVIPNMTITSGVSTPVQIVGYGSGSGGVGTYQISGSANGAVGSSGSPVAFTLSSIAGGGAIAPGPALTVADAGAGTMYPITNFPSSSPTGAINLHGTYSTGSLGGTPSSIQAQLSLVAGGPAVAGFSWTALSSQSIAGGNWSGSIAGVPSGIYWVSVRAANGTSYATMRNFVAVGSVMDFAGEGSIGAFFSNATGTQNTTIYGGPFSVQSTFGGAPQVTGPGFGKYRPQYAQAIQANRFSQSAAFYMNEGPTALAQTFTNASGVGIGLTNVITDGAWSMLPMIGGQKQIETVGIGNGSSTSWCSSSIYCANHANGALAYNAAGLTGATITGYVTTSTGVRR
jgi:fibronectin-binding autotransporter adhesin